MGLALAWMAGQDAALAYWRSSLGTERKGEALPVVPAYWTDDPVIRLRIIERSRNEPGTIAPEPAKIAGLARAVLRQTPLDGLALRQLGEIVDPGNSSKGSQYIVLAERVSRRDLPTELLSIGRAGAENDIAAAIRHIHHALAAYPAAKPQLLPRLASQLTSPEVRRILLGYAGQPWLRELVINPVDYDAPPAALMDFYAEAGGRFAIGDVQEGTARIVRWLYANQQYGALSTYASRLPGIDAKDLAAIGPNAATVDLRLVPLSWTLVNDASVESRAEGNGFYLAIEPGMSAIAASRLTLFPAGDFEFVQKLDFAADGARPRLTWNVSCPQVGLVQLLQMGPLAGNAKEGFIQRGRLSIPSGCDAQNWQLRLSADEAQLPSSLHISDLVLSRR